MPKCNRLKCQGGKGKDYRDMKLCSLAYSSCNVDANSSFTMPCHLPTLVENSRRAHY